MLYSKLDNFGMKLEEKVLSPQQTIIQIKLLKIGYPLDVSLRVWISENTKKNSS